MTSITQFVAVALMPAVVSGCMCMMPMEKMDMGKDNMGQMDRGDKGRSHEMTGTKAEKRVGDLIAVAFDDGIVKTAPYWTGMAYVPVRESSLRLNHTVKDHLLACQDQHSFNYPTDLFLPSGFFAFDTLAVSSAF
ncbi:MAG: hypothetical protein GDA65_20185 [Nitrospira sp. CR1.1]|nr:hypothetical protein [Nitrospira sp. CR1.1]